MSLVKPLMDVQGSERLTANIVLDAYQECSEKQNLGSIESSFRGKSRKNTKYSHKSIIKESNASECSVKSENLKSEPENYNFDDSQYEEVQSTVQQDITQDVSVPDPQLSSVPVHKGTFEVKIRSAKLSLNTRLTDRMSPYVMLKFGGKKQKKTDICYSAGQNPVWENQKFEFSRVDENFMTFTVHDRDESNVDHLMGEVKLSLIDDDNLSDSGGIQRITDNLKNGVVLLGSSGRKIKYQFNCFKSGLSTGSLALS
jgi:hypothetical protein